MWAGPARAARCLEPVHFTAEYSVVSPPSRSAAKGDMEMNARATKLQAAEDELKQLMAHVTRAVEKAQEAVARIAPQAAAVTAETESTISSR